MAGENGRWWALKCPRAGAAALQADREPISDAKTMMFDS